MRRNKLLLNPPCFKIDFHKTSEDHTCRGLAAPSKRNQRDAEGQQEVPNVEWKKGLLGNTADDLQRVTDKYTVTDGQCQHSD